MKNITMTKVLSWGPCGRYTKVVAARLRQFLPARRGLTPLEVCDLTEIPAEDRLWVLLREEVLPAKEMRLLACEWAESLLLRERVAGREPDPRLWTAVEVSRRWFRGETTDKDFMASEESARSAAEAAVGFSAKTAARVVIHSVNGTEARVTILSVARDAAYSIAGGTAWSTERDAQLADVRELLMRLGA